MAQPISPGIGRQMMNRTTPAHVFYTIETAEELLEGWLFPSTGASGP